MVKIAVVSLSCNKNLVDSEMILGLLVKRGYEIVPEEELADFDLVPLKAKKREIKAAMSNSFGFGGTNSSLVFKKYVG